MRRTLLFLVCFFPALSFGQSKKELIETAFLQSLRKEYVLDSINKRILEANAHLQAVKNSNAVDMPKRDSLQVLLKTKEASLDQVSKELEFLSNDLKRELKRIQGFRASLDRLSAYTDLLKQSRMNVSETDDTDAFQKACAYFEKQIDLLAPKALAEDAYQAKNVLYSYYFDLEYVDPSFIFKALENASPGAQEAQCLKKICSEISDHIDKLIEEDAGYSRVDAKRNEYLTYSRRLETSYAKDAFFLNVSHLYDLVNVLEGLKQYELALSYSNLLLKSCPAKDIKYYHYSQRCNLHMELNNLEQALKDIDLTINAYKIEKRDPTMLYLRELKKSHILIGLGRYNDALSLCEKMLSGLTSTESSRKFMSTKKALILSSKVVCLYELGRIAQADDIFDFLSEYYICDEILFYCGDEIFEPCVYHETYY
jgi:hypothetical protein